MTPFPEEISDQDFAESIGKSAWKKVLKQSKTISDVRVKSVTSIPNAEKDTYTLVYTFKGEPNPQLLGIFATALEYINAREIITFEPAVDNLTLEFSTKFVDVDSDTEE
jgi:hypothetical protein